jgi:lysophospholipase L1-like esterase
VSNQGSSLSRRFRIFVTTLVLVLIAAELSVHQWFPVRVRIFQLDDELLHDTRPSSRRILAMDEAAGGARVLIEIGPEGYRSDRALDPDAALRIACFGDSLVLAENVPQRETFVQRVGEQLTSRLAINVQSVNAGVTGYGPDQALLKLERDLSRIAPQLVIFVLCAHNDHGDLIRNKLFRLDAHDQLVRAKPVLAPELAQRFETMKQEERALALHRLFDFWSEQRARARAAEEASLQSPPYIQWYLEAAAGEFHEYLAGQDPLVYSLFRDYYDIDVAARPDADSAQYKRRLMFALMQRLRDHCAAEQVPLLVLIVPSAVDLDPQFEIRVDSIRHPGYDPNRLCAAISESLLSLGVEGLDLTECFRQCGAQTVFVGADDFHWNARGQQVAAAAVADRINQLGWIGAGSKPAAPGGLKRQED